MGNSIQRSIQRGTHGDGSGNAVIKQRPIRGNGRVHNQLFLPGNRVCNIGILGQMRTTGGSGFHSDQGNPPAACFCLNLADQTGSKIGIDFGGSFLSIGSQDNCCLARINGRTAAYRHYTVRLIVKQIAFQPVYIFPGRIGACSRNAVRRDLLHPGLLHGLQADLDQCAGVSAGSNHQSSAPKALNQLSQLIHHAQAKNIVISFPLFQDFVCLLFL